MELGSKFLEGKNCILSLVFVPQKSNWHIVGTQKIFTGEGNGTPLQYSCLENPMDGAAWSAVVYGVAKGQT